MGRYKEVRLGEYIQQVRGVSYGKSDISDEPRKGYRTLLRANNIQEHQLVANDVIYVNEECVKQEQIITKDDIIIATSSGSKEVVGKAARAKVANGYTFGAFCKLIRVNKQLDSAYLGYFFRTDYYRRTISNNVCGANINNMRNEHIDELVIPLPEIEEQKKITKVLDKAQQLIDKRKEQIQACDELIKSQFIEMFGKIRRNPNNYQMIKLGEACSKITDGKHGGCTIEEGTGYYFVGAREIYNGKINYETAPEISQQEFEKDYKRCNLENGDFIIVNTGATIGKTAIADSDFTNRTLLQKSVALLKVKEDMLVPKFLQYCYITNPEMYSVTGASAQPNLLLSKIKETLIFLPPIELQNEFTQFVQQVDKLKFGMEQSLKELEENFDSLMQRAFKGELF